MVGSGFWGVEILRPGNTLSVWRTPLRGRAGRSILIREHYRNDRFDGVTGADDGLECDILWRFGLAVSRNMKQFEPNGVATAGFRFHSKDVE